MTRVDKCLAAKEGRKLKRGRQAEVRSHRSAAEVQKCFESLPSTSAISEESTSSSSSDSELDCQTSSQSAKPKKKILTQNVLSSLDRVNVSDRKALFVVGAVAQACGEHVKDLSLSRSTIRRARREAREVGASKDKESFSSDEPLLLHWDGKMLPHIGGKTDMVERIAILVEWRWHGEIAYRRTYFP